ncbi:MAG: ABC transporter permease [Planctomycetota bacterium]|jgi:lipopolysaccharide transport system permease protein
MVVFAAILGRVAGFDRQMGPVRYAVFVYAGVVLWTFFAQSVSRSSQSLIASSRLITKVYFPRLIIPAAATGACLVDLAIASSLLGVMMVWTGAAPSANVALLPVFLALTIVAALGVGTLISALTVAYRDFRYVVPFMMQLWMFATPALYAKGLGERWDWLAAVNPMNAIVAGWRACLLEEPFAWGPTAVSATAALVAFMVGVAYFRGAERHFADII